MLYKTIQNGSLRMRPILSSTRGYDRSWRAAARPRALGDARAAARLVHDARAPNRGWRRPAVARVDGAAALDRPSRLADTQGRHGLPRWLARPFPRVCSRCSTAASGWLHRARRARGVGGKDLSGREVLLDAQPLVPRRLRRRRGLPAGRRLQDYWGAHGLTQPQGQAEVDARWQRRWVHAGDFAAQRVLCAGAANPQCTCPARWPPRSAHHPDHGPPSE
eukprot:scaffold55367_cov32-Tisochrysis_lutea.AAC.1